MRTNYVCETCLNPIVVEAGEKGPNSCGDHDPAYHVAKSYHTKAYTKDELKTCVSCSEPWPCVTISTYMGR